MKRIVLLVVFFGIVATSGGCCVCRWFDRSAYSSAPPYYAAPAAIQTQPIVTAPIVTQPCPPCPPCQ